MAERKQMNVILIRHTGFPEETVSLGAKLCYSKANIEDLKAKISEKDQSAFIQRLMNMGHESVLEHATFTFGIEGVSRALLAQITRHRVGVAFSVQSQRYVSYENGFGYIIPPSIEALGEAAVQEYHAQMNQIEEWYKNGKYNALFVAQNGKLVQPDSMPYPFVIKTLMPNYREFDDTRHFFSLRMCSRAQWEIRTLAEKMHELCLQVSPELFRDAGPACLRGKCPEGEKSCGMQTIKREEREKLLARLNEENHHAE